MCFWIVWSYRYAFWWLKINTFRCDLTDISAKKAALNISCSQMRPVAQWIKFSQTITWFTPKNMYDCSVSVCRWHTAKPRPNKDKHLPASTTDVTQREGRSLVDYYGTYTLIGMPSWSGMICWLESVPYRHPRSVSEGREIPQEARELCSFATVTVCLSSHAF